MSLRLRVYYEDTDAGGVVYYANYLRYLERDRLHYFEERGVDVRGLHEQGVEFVVARVGVEYLAPARLGDTLEVRTVLAKLSSMSLVLRAAVRLLPAGTAVARAEVKMGCLGPDGRPRVIPEDVVASLAGHVRPEEAP